LIKVPPFTFFPGVETPRYKMFTSEQDLVDLMDWQDGFDEFKGSAILF